MIHIQEKIYLYLLLLIPLFLVIFILNLIWRRVTQRHFATTLALERLIPDRSIFKSLVKFVFFIFVWICLVIALANPKMGTKTEQVKRQGIDLVFAIDVSKSMLAQDIKPNRLDKARHIVSSIVDELKTDRVGLVVYAGQAYAQLPLTTDYSIFKMFLQNINTDMLSSQGTAIAEAIRIGTDYFDQNQHNSRLLIILSDGENHEQGVSELTDKAVEKGIRLFTIGIGTQKGGTIPIEDENGITYLKKDYNDQVVITRLNQELLQKIAQQGKGEYIYDIETKNIVSQISKILNKIEKNEYETEVFSDYQDQFQWFVALALLFYVADLLILDKKTAWVQALNLFNERKNNKN